MLKVRKVTIKDRKRIVDITKNIWDGDDYLPLVFDKWVNDKNGEFIAAIDEKGKIIGFEKLTMVSENDAWIEGLRKDMKSKVKGVGVFLSNYFINKLKRNKKIRTIRFSTYFRNVESIGLFSKIGFQVLEKRNNKFYRLPKLKYIPEYKGNSGELIKDASLVMEYINKSETAKYLKKNGICLSWVCHPLTESVVEEKFIKTDRCIGIKKSGVLKALCLYDVREKQDFFVSYFSAENDIYADELFRKMKQTAYINGHKYISGIIPLKDKQWNQRFKQYRFKSWEEEEDFMLFDLQIK